MSPVPQLAWPRLRVVGELSNPVSGVVNMSRGSQAEMGGHKDTQGRLSHEPVFPFSVGQIR